MDFRRVPLRVRFRVAIAILFKLPYSCRGPGAEVHVLEEP